MNGLSLFSGAGIGELALKQIIPNYRTVGYVEWDKYCQKVIRARIKDGCLDDAPIFGDIREFNRRYASLYVGKVDFVSAGFPCQPFSFAGNRLGEKDERNLWPETRDAISIIRPYYVFLENVPGLFESQYIWRVIADLTEMRYCLSWCDFWASFLGAPYRGDRRWILSTKTCSCGLQGGWQRSTGTWGKQQFERLLRNQLQLAVPAGRRGRVAVRMANRVDGTKAAGNGWVPQVVKSVLRVKKTACAGFNK